MLRFKLYIMCRCVSAKRVQACPPCKLPQVGTTDYWVLNNACLASMEDEMKVSRWGVWASHVNVCKRTSAVRV